MQMSGIFVFHCSKVYLKVTSGDLLQFYSLQFPSFLLVDLLSIYTFLVKDKNKLWEAHFSVI